VNHKPACWKGPEEDGITQSILNMFLECPYSAYINLILGLEDNETPSENLIWGDCYHKGLEHIIADGDMANAIEKMLDRLATKYKRAPPSFKYSLPRMLRLYKLKTHMEEGSWATEIIGDQTLTIGERPIRIRYKLDGYNITHPEYGNFLVEHKCKGYTDPDLVREEIKQDLQCNFYMTLSQCEWVAYDLIKIPDVQKYGPAMPFNDSPEEWVHKLYHGPVGSYGNSYPIYRYREKWINQQVYHISHEEQQEYWERTITPLIMRICAWYDHVTSPNFSLDDPKCYNELFYRQPVRHFNGRRTEKFKCPYHAYHTGAIGLQDLRPIKSHFSELEE